MFTDDESGKLLHNGEPFEPMPLHESNGFVNGLEQDAVNQFSGMDANIQLIRHQENVEENLQLLRRKLLPYWEYFQKYGDEFVAKTKSDPESDESSIASYDRLVEEHNQVVSAEEIDLDQLSGILGRAYELFSRKPANLEVENSNLSYIQDLSARLLEQVDFFLQDRPSVPLNLEDLKGKLERYKKGDFETSGIDFTCLDRALIFVANRLHRSGFEADIARLEEIRSQR